VVGDEGNTDGKVLLLLLDFRVFAPLTLFIYL